MRLDAVVVKDLVVFWKRGANEVESLIVEVFDEVPLRVVLRTNIVGKEIGKTRSNTTSADKQCKTTAQIF